MTRSALARLAAAVALGAWFLVGFVGFAYASAAALPADPAAAAISTSDALLELFSAAAQAFRSGSPALGSILILMIAVGVLRKYGGLKWPALRGDLGGSLLLAATALLAVAASAAAAGGAAAVFAPALLWKALVAGATAGGGYTMIKRVGQAVLRKWGDHLPGWLHTALGLVTYLFEPPGDAAIIRAEAAGAEAVAAKPATGLAPPAELP